MNQKISLKGVKICFLILALSMLSQVTLTYTCKRYTYDHNLLVLDWIPQYCYHHQSCKPNWKQIIPQSQWIIKGFWPASKDLDFLNCIQYTGRDPNCYVAYRYDDALLPTSMTNQLNSYWPQITTSNDIKQDQWNQHGTCYLSIVQTMNQSMIGGQDKVFASYFKDSIMKAKTLKLKIDSNQTGYNTKAQLAATLGAKQTEFYALCQYDPDYLSQIRVCYGVSGVPGSQKVIDCKVQQPNECEFPVKIRKTSSDYYLKFIIALLMLSLMLIY